MDTYSPPKTLKEKLLQDRNNLYNIRNVIFNAIQELLSGQATVSYSLLNRSETKSRADLKSMQEQLKSIELQIAEIEAMLWGRARRATITHSYLSPSSVIWGGLV